MNYIRGCKFVSDCYELGHRYTVCSAQFLTSIMQFNLSRFLALSKGMMSSKHRLLTKTSS